MDTKTIRVETDTANPDYCYVYVGKIRACLKRQELLRAVEKATLD